MDPPFEEKYKGILENYGSGHEHAELFRVDEGELPLIDLTQLTIGGQEMREECEKKIAKASREWGFFQVVNHGIPKEILERMTSEEMKVLRKPFDDKVNGNHGLPGFSYVWGSPFVPNQISDAYWSEALEGNLAHILSTNLPLTSLSLSSAIQEHASAAFDLAHTLVDVLAKNMGHSSSFFKENCLLGASFIRMNRYPPCPFSPNFLGFVPHTDSTFLTIVHQDNVGGLQLLKDGKWIAVKPHQDALVINIGDFLQAWSNDEYHSVKHRVVVDKPDEERFSTAFFLRPADDAMIQSCVQPSLYRSFNYKQFRQQIVDDFKKVGYKIGLPSFLK